MNAWLPDYSADNHVDVNESFDDDDDVVMEDHKRRRQLVTTRHLFAILSDLVTKCSKTADKGQVCSVLRWTMGVARFEKKM